MGAAEVFASVDGPPLPQAAARFAAAGVPVFPCVPGGKRPRVEHGFREATADARQVAAWWRRWPAANIGVPTGQVSGVEVVDVDRKASGAGFGAFARAREAGLVGGWLAVVRTPSGGAHFYFPTDPGRPQPSWQAAKAHIDFRGEGGYVIVPPSVVATGDLRASYVLAGGVDRSSSAVDAKALRDFLDPRPEPSMMRARGVTRDSDAERLAAWVALRGEGAVDFARGFGAQTAIPRLKALLLLAPRRIAMAARRLPQPALFDLYDEADALAGDAIRLAYDRVQVAMALADILARAGRIESGTI